MSDVSLMVTTSIPPDDMDLPAYSNAYSDETIICSINYKERDLADPRLQPSEMLFQQYRNRVEEKMPEYGIPDLSKLQYIWRISVWNDTTRSIAKDCEATTKGRTLYLNGEPEFFRMLGTPNCGTVPRLLRDHGIALGRKTIASIEIFPESALDRDLVICVELSEPDVVGPIDTPQKRPRRRNASKSNPTRTE